jgi:TonB family protein
MKAADVAELYFLFHPEEAPPEPIVDEPIPSGDRAVPAPAEERLESVAQPATDSASAAGGDQAPVAPPDEILAGRAGPVLARTRILLEIPATPVPAPDSAPEVEMRPGRESSPGCGLWLFVAVIAAGLLLILARLVPSESSGNATAVDLNIGASDSAAPADSSPLSASSPQPATYPTSFACRRHMSGVERTICESRTLAAKDQEMALLYRTTLGAADGDSRARTRTEQRQWLQARARCGDAVSPSSCLEELYEQRIAGLRRLAVPRNGVAQKASAPEGTPPFVAPPSSPVDQAPPKPDLTQPATLLTGSVEPGDYPQGAASEGFEGQTTVRFTVGVDGGVTACLTLSSSGHSILDRQACSIIRRRFRFNPAHDSEGRNVEDVLTKTVTWKLRD